MFYKHQAIISEYGRTDSESFARVLNFVVLTIRARLFNIPADMEMLERPESPDDLSGILYGFKARAIGQIEMESRLIYGQAESIWYHAESRRQAEESLLNLFRTIHGFGLVKSGFACTLLYGVSACLDGHNLARFNIPRYAFHSTHYKRAKTLKTRRRYITKYCDLVQRCGGTASLWDSWCEFVYARPDSVGDKIGVAYKSAYHVSALHCYSLGLPG